MIWHILKKDWKVLWPFVVAVGGIWWVASFILFRLDFGANTAALRSLGTWTPITALFCSLFLVAAIAQTEAIPGVRQDWLVRPIARRDLLMEKLLFTVMAVGGPIFTANLFEELAHGFSLPSSLSGAGWEAIFFSVFLVFPVLALASVTHNMTEAFIFGGACTLIFGVLFNVSDSINRSMRGMLTPVPYSGIGWVGVILRAMIAIAGAAAVLCVQYFYRKTRASRVVLGASTVLLLCVQLLPWKPAFAVEEHFSREPLSGTATTIAFDPTQKKFEPPSGATFSANYDPVTGDPVLPVFLPLQVRGVGDDSILLSDYVVLRVSGQTGKLVYRGTGQRMEAYGKRANSPMEPSYQGIGIPMTPYSATKDQPVNIQADYSLTLFHLAQSYAMAALHGVQRIPILGSCKTAVNNVGTAVTLGCIASDMPPACMMASLENTETGAQNPARPSCRSEYEAYPVPPLPDSLARYGISIPFRDTFGLAKYPVDGSQLAHARVVIRVYEPVDHFTRTVMMPNVRLADWAEQ